MINQIITLLIKKLKIAYFKGILNKIVKDLHLLKPRMRRNHFYAI